jgi:hypothetical protein
MKKVLTITAVSVAVSFAMAGMVNAEYPPIEEVKPSTLVPAISFDRTPATVDPAARKVDAPVAAGAVKAVKVFVGEAFTPVIPNLPAAAKFKVTITTADGKSVTLPSVKSLNNGRLRLPTLAVSKAGTYTVKVTASNGKVRTIRINAGK